MPLALTSFPLAITQGQVISFHDGFEDDRHGSAHQAVDMAAPQGTPVRATTDGLVVHSWMSGSGPVTGAGWSTRGGFVVLIVDNNGYAHYYAHMARSPRVQSGQTVRAGATIGEVSNTGSIADGGPVHLHYQVWAVGRGRETEAASGIYTRRFGVAVNAHSELARLARGLGASVGSNGSVRFGPPRH
jgi:murein DD-endopeptidase MepM/ murein hydrolase activator NlpD